MKPSWSFLVCFRISAAAQPFMVFDSSKRYFDILREKLHWDARPSDGRNKLHW